ncbi:unnamed protein product [Adineta ricciae]|uniref:Uncharacterized protein n=1 Tax=Adineta ricciae TaxID=249248 RepID=A0A814HA68_ADIRI|nr:unnamed protein product [Adineta ricciae]
MKQFVFISDFGCAQFLSTFFLTFLGEFSSTSSSSDFLLSTASSQLTKIEKTTSTRRRRIAKRISFSYSQSDKEKKVNQFRHDLFLTKYLFNTFTQMYFHRV